MALVKCKECGKKVSNKADVCVECGYPLSKNKKNSSEEIKTLQQTRKSLKLQLLLSKVIVIVIGALLIFYYASMQYDKVEIALWFLIAATVWYIVSKVRIWWNHS